MKKTPENSFRKQYVKYSQKVLGTFISWMAYFDLDRTYFVRFLSWLDKHLYIRQFSILFLFSLFFSYLLFYDTTPIPRLVVGQVVSSDVKSPINFSFYDKFETEKKRDEAEKNVPSVFDYDAKFYMDLSERMKETFLKLRKPSSAITKKQFEDIFEVSITTKQFLWLKKQVLWRSFEREVSQVLKKLNSYKISSDLENLGDVNKDTLILRNLETKEETTLTGSEIKSLKSVKDSLKNEIISVYYRKGSRFKDFLSLFLKSNLNFNQSETKERRKKARDAIQPVKVSFKRNQKVISAGSVVQPIDVLIVKELNQADLERRFGLTPVAVAFLIVVLVFSFLFYVQTLIGKRTSFRKKDLVVIGVLAFLSITFGKIFLFFSELIAESYFSIPLSALVYSLPMAFGPLMVGVIISSQALNLIFLSFISVSFAVMFDLNFNFFLLSFVGGLVVLRMVYNLHKRNSIYTAGFYAGIINALLIVFLFTFRRALDGQVVQEDLLWYPLMALMGGVSSSLLAMMLLPFFESAFNYTTDIKLLELSNLSHPLMQDLFVKAPGTYHHSLIVGSMVETAAEKIGCNPLLGKVMAYYHDIGKMDHAQYFIENQRKGFNPHDEISPYMSKTILIAHVKDGAEMALKHKLGRPIVDGILQHHGTTRINYFYNRAVELEKMSEVKEAEFRYPGPKPQFKEAALVMLADSIEATARSLDDPSPQRLQTVVENTIKSRFSDGQLDECDLTLKDLSTIEKTFEHVLIGIYHHRIDYPESKNPKVQPLRDAKKS